MDGFLRQLDGEIAGIAAIYTKSSTEDVALIKVGDQAVLTGYGQPHDYASSASTVISEKVDSLNFENVTYTAGGFNPECLDGKDRPMWHTNLPPRAHWVHKTIHFNVGLSLQEKFKAENGLKYRRSAVGNRSRDPYRAYS